MHCLHRTKTVKTLIHPVHCGSDSAGLDYTSPFGCNIAERVRPRGGYKGKDYTSGTGKAALTGYTSQDDNGGEPVALAAWQLACVAEHDIGIYGGGAMQTATAKVMEFASQNHFELKCRGAATLGRRRNLL